MGCAQARSTWPPTRSDDSGGGKPRPPYEGGKSYTHPVGGFDPTQNTFVASTGLPSSPLTALPYKPNKKESVVLHTLSCWELSSLPCQQLHVGSLFNDLTMLQDHNAVHEAQWSETMGNDDRCAFRGCPLKSLNDFPLAPSIQPGRRPIQNQKGGIANHRPPNAIPLFLPPRGHP